MNKLGLSGGTGSESSIEYYKGIEYGVPEKSVGKGKKTSKSEFLKWFMPLLHALRDLGGSATPAETRKKKL